MILSVSGVTADTSDPLNGAGVTPVYAGLFAFICMLRFYPNKTKTERPTLFLSPQWSRCDSGIWGNRLRSIPFLMSGHLNFNFFKAFGTPLLNTNLNNGCPNMIYQHSGQAHKHFSHRFHSKSFLADVQT